MFTEFTPAVNKHTKSNTNILLSYLFSKASEHTPICRSPERSKLWWWGWWRGAGPADLITLVSNQRQEGNRGTVNMCFGLHAMPHSKPKLFMRHALNLNALFTPSTTAGTPQPNERLESIWSSTASGVLGTARATEMLTQGEAWCEEMMWGGWRKDDRSQTSEDNWKDRSTTLETAGGATHINNRSGRWNADGSFWNGFGRSRHCPAVLRKL